MRLGLKFNLVMSAAFICGLALATVFVDTLTQRIARRSVLSNAASLMAEVDATIHYTNSEVAPLLGRLSKVQFLPQSVPFYAAERSFGLLTKELPEYSLRQPADNPTNPSDRPQQWEADIIAALQADPRRTSLTTERMTEAGEIMSLARPIRVGAECLQCHSTPEAAPAAMLDVYGSHNGFGWKLGSIVGAQIVSVPERVALSLAHDSLYILIGALAAVFTIMLVVLNLMLHAIIVAPVRRMARMADEVSLGNLDAPEFEHRSRDEISSLATSFNRMRRSLVAAFRLLDA